MIELKRLKLINWHNFENTTFDCARLTYMIGVNAVGKTTILDAIRYCLTTNRNFNALGNKKSGRTLQGSVHAKQRGENAYRRPGHTVAYIGAEFWDSDKHTSFVIAVRVESEGPMQELHPGDQTWYISEDGITLEQLPFIDPRTGAPSAKEDFKPAEGRLSYTRSPSEARDRICPCAYPVRTVSQAACRAHLPFPEGSLPGSSAVPDVGEATSHDMSIRLVPYQ